VSGGKTLKIKPQSPQRARSFKLFLAFLAHFAVKNAKATRRGFLLAGL
jgi:hypothetical protein